MSRFIGNVSAYAYAVEKGYTGTEEEFALLMASYANVGQRAVEAAQTATTKASEASQSATTAINKASEATTAAQTATNKAAEAQTSAQTASTKASEASTATTAAQTAKTATEQIASQALTDISTARSGAINAVQTEGATQTANARAQAQAAAQSATTASTKASEASASATSAGLSATNAAASATSAAQSASNAQDVLESIPEDYSDLSADVSQLRADLGAVNGRLDGFVNVERTANLFNPARLLTGYYYAPDRSGEKTYDIKPVENSAFVCTYIDVEYGKDYIASGIGFNAYTADSNGKAVGIAKQSSSNTPNAILDSTAVSGNYGNANAAARIYISWRPSVYPLNTFMVVEGTTLPSEYIPYDEKGILSENITVYESQIAKKEYHVDVNGGGDYTSFSACLLALKDDTSPKTIYVHGGTYDVFEELGGETTHAEFTDHTKWADYSIFVPPNTDIIGVGMVILEYMPETTETNVEASKSISPINVQGTCHIENIEVRVKNGRYCVHDEIDKRFIGSKKTYKNVRMIHYKNDPKYGYSQAYACGFSLENEYIFEDCYFENSDIYTFTFHNANMTATYDGDDVINHSSKINVKNCIFMTNGYATPVRFGNNSPYLQHVLVRFDNCYFVPYGATKTGILIFNEYTNENLVNAFDVELNGCSSITPSITATNNQYTIKQYNGIVSTMPVVTPSV